MRLPGALVVLVRELALHRHALRVFVEGHFRAKHRAQALGIFWPLANPLLLTLVMSVVFGYVFPQSNAAYPVFLLIGLVLWNFLAHAWTEGTRAFVTNAALVRHTALPSHLVVVGTVLSNGLALGFASLSLVPLVAFYPDAFQLSPALLALPILLALYGILVISVALLSALLHVVYRDVAYVVDSILLLLFWVTPIVYPLDRFPPRVVRWMLVNPLAAIFQGVRDIVMGGRLPPVTLCASATVSTLVVTLVAVHAYRRHAPHVPDHV